jgi:hypothetical protein
VKERDDAEVSFGMFAASSTSKLANANCLEKSVAELKSIINCHCLLSACAECQCCRCKAGVEGEERRGEEKRSSSSSEEKGDQTPKAKKNGSNSIWTGVFQ